MAEKRNGPRTRRQRRIGGEVHVRVLLIRLPRLSVYRQKRAQMLIGGLDGIRGAVRVVGVVIIIHAKVRACFGPNVVGFRRMNTHARVDVRVRIGDLIADAGCTIHQAVDERRSWILKDLLGAGLSAGLRPVVVLHRDHEHLFHSARVDGETSTPHCSG